MTYTLGQLSKKAVECRQEAEEARSPRERERWMRTADHWLQLMQTFIDSTDDEIN